MSVAERPPLARPLAVAVAALVVTATSAVVENDVAVARASRHGLLTLADGRGRLVAEAPSRPDRTTAVTADLPLGRGRTPYALTGDWFGWLCLTGVAVARAVTSRSRPSRSRPSRDGDRRPGSGTRPTP